MSGFWSNRGLPRPELGIRICPLLELDMLQARPEGLLIISGILLSSVTLSGALFLADTV